jgi:hypothetical protein
MRKWTEALAVAVLLAGLSSACGQPGAGGKTEDKPPTDKKEPAKSQLEEMLAQALRDNADIRVAEAKVHETEAELHRVRLQVIQKVTVLTHEIDLAEKMAAEAKARYDQMTRSRQLAPGSVSDEDYRGAMLSWQRYLAELAVKKAELPFLLGKQQVGKADDEKGRTERALYALQLAQAQHAWDKAAQDQAVAHGLAWLAAQQFQAKHGPVADKIRAALDKRVTVDLKAATRAEAIRAVSEAVREAAPELVIHLRPQDLGAATQQGERDNVPLPVRLNDVPVAGALQYLEDILGGNCRFVVRDYGLLFARTETLPPGAVLMTDFWKAGKAEKEKGGGGGPAKGGGDDKGGGPADGGKRPPAEDVEGLVTEADSSGLVKINVGSDAGLQKGQTLEAFRLSAEKGEARYLGTVRVIDVSPKAAVCQPVGKLQAPARVGDHVASRILGK